MEPTTGHDAYKVIRMDQGWETGLARCTCGREYPITFKVARVRGRERITVDSGQRCPDDTGDPAHRADVDARFAEWWTNAGRHVTKDSPRKGLAYLGFCAGVRYGRAQDAPAPPQPGDAQPRAGSATHTEPIAGASDAGT